MDSWLLWLEVSTIIRFTKPCGKLSEYQNIKFPLSLFSCGISLCSIHYRLYGCLRLACGWILWHARAVDDGRFRKHICEALFVCYVLQTIAILRAQFTDRHSIINWIAILVMSLLGAAYGSFRFGKGGNLIKVYELPTGANII